MLITILLIAGGGYVVYRSFAATGINREPSQQEVYDHLKKHAKEFNAIVLAPGTDIEGIRLPYSKCVAPSFRDNQFIGGCDEINVENYVILTNPKASNRPNTCFNPLTKQGQFNRKIYSGQTFLNTVQLMKDISSGENEDYTVSLRRVISISEKTALKEFMKGIMGKSTGLGEEPNGDNVTCNDNTDNYSGVSMYKAAYAEVKKNLQMYGLSYDPGEMGLEKVRFAIYQSCYKLYDSQNVKDDCVNQPSAYLSSVSDKKTVSDGYVQALNDLYSGNFGRPAPVFDNYHQQLVQIALGKGASANYLKALCDSYGDPQGCRTFIDQSCAYFHFCGNPPPGPATTPVWTPPQPPPKDPRRGEDDGHWQQSFNKNFYSNPALPGRCIFKRADGSFAVGVNSADYGCNQLAQMYKCQGQMAKLNPKDPSSFTNANISPECGDQSKLRAAGRYVEWVLLNETPPKGNLEGKNSDCTIQTGWAYSEINTNVPLDVDLYYDGPAGTGTLYTVKADVQRDDLKGFGNNGIHGFAFTIPDKYKDTNFHTVYAYAKGIQVSGWLNNKNPLVGQTTFQCDYPPTGNLEKIDAKMEGGTFTCKVQGWAFDRSNLNISLQVHGYIDGIPGRSNGIAVGNADIYRDDLKNAGQGNGKHGFYFDIPAQFRDANKHTLRVYALGINSFWTQNGMNSLIGTMDFQCDQLPDGNLEIATRRLKPSDALAVECVVGGWTADKSNNSFYDTKVSLYFDLSADSRSYSSKVENMPTGIDRPDVRAAGWGWGNAGNHGFVYQIPKQYWDNKNHTVHAYSMNTDAFGNYIKQNNTYIGTKTFNCGT